MCSRALRHWAPQQHAELVRRFLQTGLELFGKTATPGFALRAKTAPLIREHPTRNPWDPTPMDNADRIRGCQMMSMVRADTNAPDPAQPAPMG